MKKGPFMNMSSQQILTLVSALDSYRRYMKDVVYNQSKSIEHTQERDEIFQSLKTIPNTSEKPGNGQRNRFRL